MKTTHLSPWEQEEYVIDRPTPQMLRHLSECAECRGAVEGLQRSTAVFRSAAMEWSAESLAARPRQLLATGARRPVTALRWAIAAVLPLVLMVLVFLGLHPSPGRLQLSIRRTIPRTMRRTRTMRCWSKWTNSCRLRCPRPWSP